MNYMKDFWAKDNGETLYHHSVAVKHIADELCKNLPLSNGELATLLPVISELAILHDIGKATPGFQNMLKYGIPWRHRHEILSVAVAAKIAPHLEPEELLAIITHHRIILPAVEGTTFGKCLPDNELPFLKPNIFDLLTSELCEVSDGVRGLLYRLKAEGKFDWQLDSIDLQPSSLGPLTYKWLLRSSDGQKATATAEQRKRASLMRGLLVTSDHLASAGEKNVPPVPVLSDHVSTIRTNELRDNEALPFQELSGQIQGSCILRAPTGSGKTLAMLLWAAKNQTLNGRFYYTLPYTASINAMYKRLRKMLPDSSVGILHHKNAAFLFQMYESEHSARADEYAKSLADLARELYFPIKVLTPHQILRVALRGKGWELGLAEFPNCCLVFDEIHAYDPLIVGLIVACAKWVQSLGAKILVASATMPQFLEDIFRNELKISSENIIQPDPHNEKDCLVLDKKRHRVRIAGDSLVSNLDNIVKVIQDNPHQKVLIVCNYVATSQDVCKHLKEQGVTDFLLLHARFNAMDRYRIEDQITSNNPPRVLVATQAVEVSLDIDYDVGYTEPAPIDALVQRFGRVNRKGKRKPALITIYEQQSVQSSRPIYDPQIVQTTIELLRNYSEISEDDLIKVLNDVYGDGYQGIALEKYKQGLHHQSIEKFDEMIVAGMYEDWVNDVIEKTDGQIEVLPYNCVNEDGSEKSLRDEFVRLKKKHEYLKAKMLLVPIRVVQFQIAKRNGTIKWDSNIQEWVTTLHYSSKLGLDLKNQFETIL